MSETILNSEMQHSGLCEAAEIWKYRKGFFFGWGEGAGGQCMHLCVVCFKVWNTCEVSEKGVYIWVDTSGEYRCGPRWVNIR